MLKSLGWLKGTFTKKPGSSASNILVSFNFYLKRLLWTNTKYQVKKHGPSWKWCRDTLNLNQTVVPYMDHIVLASPSVRRSHLRSYFLCWRDKGPLVIQPGLYFFLNLQGCEFSIVRWDSKRHTQVPNPLSILHCWRVNPQIVDELLLLRVEPILDPDDHSGFSSPWASYRIISVNFHYIPIISPLFPGFDHCSGEIFHAPKAPGWYVLQGC